MTDHNHLPHDPAPGGEPRRRDACATDAGGWIRDVLDQYERRLIAYAMRITGDVETARDVVQDVFLKLCQAEQSSPGSLDGHLAQWLYTVCRNRAVDIHRKESRTMPLTFDHSSKHEKPRLRTGGSAEDAGHEPAPIKHERCTAMLRALSTLPERQQEILRLKFQGNLSYKEIASVLDLSVSNVGVIIHTAVKSLREQLRRSGDGSEQTMTSPSA